MITYLQPSHQPESSGMYNFSGTGGGNAIDCIPAACLQRQASSLLPSPLLVNQCSAYLSTDAQVEAVCRPQGHKEVSSRAHSHVLTVEDNQLAPQTSFKLSSWFLEGLIV